jgi:DnaA family protein
MTHRPQQLTLDIVQPLRPSFDNFVVGRNAEAVASLRGLVAGGEERFGYLWGPDGCGRSHLLQALSARADRFLDSASAGEPFRPRSVAA